MDDTTTDGTEATGAGPDPELLAAEAAVMARLRAADPALMASTDLRALREHVATRAAEPVTVHPIAASASRRRSRWLQVAAVAAGVAVVAGTGFTAGRMGRPAAPAADSSRMESSRGAAVGPQASADGIAGLSDAGDKGSEPSAGGWTSAGHTVFTSKGLATTGTSAHAYAFDADERFSGATAAAIAAALGASGEPRNEYDSWVVGPADGNGPTVTLSTGGTTSFSYYNPGLSPWCTPGDVALDRAGDDEASAGATPAVTSCTGSGGPAPSSDAAIAEVKAVVTQLGLDPEGLSYVATASTDGGSDSSTYASVDISMALQVNGLATDVAWYATVTADGIQSMSGAFPPVTDLGEYSVISPSAAVGRLGDSRFGVINTIYPAVMDEGSGSLTATGGADSTPSAPTTAGARLPWSVATAVIVSAQLGMATVYPSNGAPLLLPVWNLTDATGVVWTTLAVADDQLDMSGS